MTISLPRLSHQKVREHAYTVGDDREKEKRTNCRIYNENIVFAVLYPRIWAKYYNKEKLSVSFSLLFSDSLGKFEFAVRGVRFVRSLVKVLLCVFTELTTLCRFTVESGGKKY